MREIMSWDQVKSKMTIAFAVFTALVFALLLSISLLQHQARSSAQLISEDIGRDLVVSNLASAERRIEILRHVGQLGLSLEIQGNSIADISKRSCLSQATIPISIDGILLAKVSNCISFNNLMPSIAHSPSVITLFFMLILVLLAIMAIRLRMQKIAIETKKNQEMADLYRQVAHDIRSPLSALGMLLEEHSSMQNDQQALLKHSITRISDIANTLLNRSTKKESQSISSGAPILSTKTQHLATLIEVILSEKRAQYTRCPNVSIVGHIEKGLNLFSNFNALELGRILSNLITNSIEAFSSNAGQVTISLSESDQFAVIKISDNGRGIPQEILAKLGTKGFSHGKEGRESGSGLGIYHAKTMLEKMNGRFSISSVENKGTEIIVEIPKTLTPSWLQSSIILPLKPTIAILDDDKSIHSAWDTRFSLAKLDRNNSNVYHFYSIAEFEVWIEAHKADLYLIDHDIEELAPNGLDIIERNSIAKNSILVTSRFEEEQIQDRVSTMKLSILPKSLLKIIPISVTIPEATNDVVLLDDDMLIRMTWQHFAKKSGINLKVFSTPEELFLELPSIGKSTKFYIDNQLSDGIRGTDIALKLHQSGFTELYLATGSEPEEFAHITYIKGVIGKKPVW